MVCQKQCVQHFHIHLHYRSTIGRRGVEHRTSRGRGVEQRTSRGRGVETSRGLMLSEHGGQEKMTSRGRGVDVEGSRGDVELLTSRGRGRGSMSERAACIYGVASQWSVPPWSFARDTVCVCVRGVRSVLEPHVRASVTVCLSVCVAVGVRQTDSYNRDRDPRPSLRYFT